MKCSVDRIEEGMAVLIVKGGGRMEIPLSQFPFKIKEGTFLNVEFSVDKAEKAKVKKSIAAIKKRLLNKRKNR